MSGLRLLPTPATEQLIRAGYAAGRAARGLGEDAAADALAAFLAEQGLPVPGRPLRADYPVLGEVQVGAVVDAWLVGYGSPDAASGEAA